MSGEIRVLATAAWNGTVSKANKITEHSIFRESDGEMSMFRGSTLGTSNQLEGSENTVE